MSNFDLIAIDVDGTLLNDDEQVSTRTREALHAAQQAGVEIVLCTGRGPTNTFPVLEQLQMTGTIITHNGAATVDARSREVIHHFALQNEHLQPYIDYCQREKCHFDLNTTFELMTESVSAEVAAMYDAYHVTPIIAPFTQPLPTGLLKMTLFGTEKEMDKVELDWQTWSHPLAYIRSGVQFIDVQHPQASKGHALQQLVQMRGYQQQRVMAIGNYYNDIGMLQYAAVGVAVDNSPVGVKEVAQVITRSNNDDGVAHAIEQYVLGTK